MVAEAGHMHGGKMHKTLKQYKICLKPYCKIHYISYVAIYVAIKPVVD